MRFSKLVGALLGLAGSCLLGVPVPAQAAPAAVGVDEVVKALGLAPEPADYVVVVDTSGSMNQGGRYNAVRRELRKLLADLDADDRVSLLTFDSKADARFRGVIGKNPDDIMAKLPAKATGDHTDIGAGIAAGLKALEREDTHRLTALILITDGKMDTLPGSAYANNRSPAWRKLRTRATQLAIAHEVAAYAVSLKATTDAALLKKVFPRATEVSSTEVGNRFGQVAGDLVRLQAAKALKDELAAPILVTWAGDLGAALANNTPAVMNLEFTSPYAHVPVELSGLQVKAPAGLRVALSGLPDKVTLEPGSHVTVQAQATVSGTPGADAGVSLVAKVTSPWAKVLEKDLGLAFAPVLAGSAVVPQPPIKLPPSLLPTLGVTAVMVAFGAVLLLIGRTLLTPRMDGLLAFTRNGRAVADVVVKGRRMKLAAPEGASGLAGLSGVLVGAWGATRGQRAVRINAHRGAERASGLVADGGVIQMGDMEITYVSGRSRVLEKIGRPNQ